METKTTTYTPSDVGCYVDNARGIYMTDRIVDIANKHGANIKHDCDSNGYPDGTCWDDVSENNSQFAGCQFAHEFVDQASDYMNEHYGVNNCYWGTSDTFGDWGLWAVIDDLS